jgi:hypothetical protein
MHVKLRRELVPHTLRDGVLNSEVRASQVVNVPLLKVKFVSLLLIPNDHQEKHRTECRSAGDKQSLSTLVVKSAHGLHAEVLHVDLGRVRQTSIGTIMNVGLCWVINVVIDILCHCEITTGLACTGLAESLVQVGSVS